jgi:hypothetical protein
MQLNYKTLFLPTKYYLINMKNLLLLTSFMFCLNASGQGITVSFPNSDLCVDSNYTITWSGGSPADVMNIVVIDIQAWTVDFYIAGNVPNTGSYSWTCNTGSFGLGTKCIYVETISQSLYGYGPNFELMQCCSNTIDLYNVNVCSSDYFWIEDSTTYTSSGYYSVMYQSQLGCDSVVALDLTLNVPPLNTITQNGALLTADQNGGTYQWLDCDNNYAVINGETNQSYTPVVTGNYAVEVTLNGCVDTSACFLVDYTGIEELPQNEKELILIVDFMGRETEFKPNTPLIFIYSDGTRERVMKIEE